MNLRNLKDSKLYDLIWYMFGSMTFGFTSLIYMIIITRTIGIEEAGKFSIAFAIACLFYMIGVYFGRTFQVTDLSKKYSDSDYIYNKITTCIIMFAVAVIFCLIKNYSSEKVLLILILTLYRGVDAFLESIYGVIQKKDKINKIGKLTFFRTVFLVLAFLVSAIFLKNVLICSLIIFIVDILYIFVFDYRVAKHNITVTKYNYQKNISLIIEGFSVFLFSFFALYIINSPKYAIDYYSDDVIQGIFGIIVMPASFLILISAYLIQPFLNEITECVNKNMIKKLIVYVLKLSMYIFIGGIFVIFLGYLIGIPVLNWLYNINLINYKFDLAIILAGSIFYSIYSLISAVLIAMRHNKAQVVMLLLTSLFAYIVCKFLIKNNGVNGASWAYFYTMLFQLLLYICFFGFKLYTKIHTKTL